MERVKSIDISKGISIILMTFSHLLVVKKHPEITNLNINYFMIFKMPLFIIISGILFSNKKNIKDFIRSKVDSLLKPTISTILLFSLTSLLVWGAYNPDGISLKAALAKTILIAFPLWFIFSLFFSLVIFRFIFSILEHKDNGFKFAVITTTILFLALLNVYNLKYYFINLSTIIYFLLYLFIGYVIKWKLLLKYLISTPVFITSVIIFITFILLKQKIDISLSLTNNIFDPFFLTLLYSVVCSIMVLNISNIIAKQKWLAQFLILCGRSSFFILSFHIALGNFILPYLIPKDNQSYIFDILILIFTILGCILLREIFKYTRITRYLFLPKNQS